jgi:hypothetical protein
MNVSPSVVLAGLVVALFVSLQACTDPRVTGPDPSDPEEPEPPPPNFSGTCESEGGKSWTGTVSGTWYQGHSPHRVADMLYVSGELLIEAGALVCLGPDAAISWRLGEAGKVVAAGTAEAPVVFTADRPGGTWGGFVFRTQQSVRTAEVDLTHVVIENATTGIDLGYSQSAQVSDGVIRRITGPGVHAGGIRLRNVVVDSVCLGGRGCAAVLAGNYASVVLEDVWIRDSGGGGVEMGDRGTLTLANMRITGSAGTGLALYWLRSGEIGEVVHPIHITGGRGQPASLHASVVPHLLPSLEAQERWTGNAEDVISVYHSGSLGELVVGPRLAWALSSNGIYGPTVTHLTMLPGARFSGGRVDRFTAEGTPEHPIAIHGTILYGSDAGPSRIVHGRLRNVIIRSGEAHALEISDVLAENGYVSLDAPGSRLERVLVRGVLDPWPDTFDPVPPPFPRGATPTEALRIAAADVVVEWCQVAHSPSDGIRVEVADGVRIRDCNIENNAGVGIRNVAAEPVDARDNWWGDPEGPEGAEGDGVHGGVTFEPYRTTPVALDAPVASTVVLTPTARTVAVGDTVWFSAVVLDGGGLPLWTESLEWRSSDTIIVAVDGTGLTGMAAGLTEGTVQVTVMVRSDTTLRQMAAVEVVAGAPLYRWTQLDLQAWSMWGNPETGLYAGGQEGIYHYDGDRWELRWSLQDIGADHVRSIGGLASDDLWAFGLDFVGGKTLFRWDGTAWHRIPAPFARGERLWVAGPNQVYVVSEDTEPYNGLWYYDGAGFRQVLAELVWGVWGGSSTDLFVGTSTGTLHFDGSTWRNTGEPRYARAFWGTGDQVFSVSGWALYRYDGAAWERLDCSIDYWLEGIWGTSPSNVYMVGAGGVVRHYDGSRCWTVWLVYRHRNSVHIG